MTVSLSLHLAVAAEKKRRNFFVKISNDPDGFREDFDRIIL